MIKVKKPTLQEVDTSKNWGTWSKEPSSFPWYYEEKEICYIISGKAEVQDSLGNRVTFEAGDWVEFDKGLTCTWKVLTTIKKRYRFG